MTARSCPLAGVDPGLRRALPHAVHDQNQRANDEAGRNKAGKQRRSHFLSRHLGERRNVYEHRDTEDEKDRAEDGVVEFHLTLSPRAPEGPASALLIPSKARDLL